MNVIDEATLEAMRQLGVLVTSVEHNPLLQKPAADYKRGIDIYSMASMITIMSNAMRAYKSVHDVYPDILNPQGFNQKILYRKFFEPLLIGKVGNKLATSFFIPDELRTALTCPPLVWRSEQHFLPANDAVKPGHYYLKANHGSNFNRAIQYPLTSEQRLDLEAETQRWLNSTYGVRSGEWWYNVFKKEIFIENNISPDQPAISFNFFVTAGKVVYICMHLKQTNEELYLDDDFLPIHDNANRARFLEIIQALKQDTKEKLKSYAAAIGKSFSFVRVDFFVGSDETVYLAELTFSPGNGLPSRPEGFDERLGVLWILNQDLCIS